MGPAGTDDGFVRSAGAQALHANNARFTRCNAPYGVTKCRGLLAMPAQSRQFSTYSYRACKRSMEVVCCRRFVALKPQHARGASQCTPVRPQPSAHRHLRLRCGDRDGVRSLLVRPRWEAGAARDVLRDTWLNTWVRATRCGWWTRTV